VQVEREPLKRSVSSRSGGGPAPSSSAARRPSLHAVGDVLARRGLSPPPAAPAPGHWSDRHGAAVALPRCLERLLSVDSAGVRSAMDRSLVKVHLANGCFNVFKCSDCTTVKVHSRPSESPGIVSVKFPGPGNLSARFWKDLEFARQ